MILLQQMVLHFLGADNKSGVAEIMDAVNYFLTHPEVKHGTIKICFTPDEETGRGTEKFDLKKFDAKYAYTVDGQSRGEVESETFSADGVNIKFHGKNIHPGYAKGINGKCRKGCSIIYREPSER